MSAFEILAEVAIGVAGFGTIALVLAQDRRTWESADRYRTAALLLSSFGAVLLALLPIGLATTSLSPETIWRASSGAMVAFFAVHTLTVTHLRRRYLEREYWIGPPLSYVIFASSLANLGFQVVNTLGAPLAPNPTSYFFGVIWFLAFAVLILARLLFVRGAPR